MQHTPEQLWLDFQTRHQLSDEQRTQFEQYAHALIQFNKTHNITAITTPARVVIRHFDDSLILAQAYDVAHKATRDYTICDVGTGGGFPALPLKIKYPQLKLVLIEVNHKKIEFLHALCESLKLTDVTLDERDWRTFLRPTTEKLSIDLFVSRASLPPEELVRIYRPTGHYRDVPLVYWAAQTWHATPKIVSYVSQVYPYVCGNIERKLIFFKAPSA